MTVAASDGTLASLRWKNRVLVVVARSALDENLTTQRSIFRQNTAGMSERQIILIEAAGDDPRARAIRRQLAAGEDPFKVFLLGKDGNTALTSTKPLSAERLFGTIDAMPMRRDEMRRERK